MGKEPLRYTLFVYTSFVLLLLSACGRGYHEGIYTDEELEALRLLDETVDRRPAIFSAKETTLDSLRAVLSTNPADRIKADLYESLTEAYLSYQFDSAFKYVRLRNDLQERIDGASLSDRAEGRLQEILVLTSAGLFNESTDLLGDLDTAGLAPGVKEHALWVAAKTNYDLLAYTRSVNGVDIVYRRRTIELGNELISLLPQKGWERPFVHGHVAITSGDAEGAVRDF